MRGGVSHRLSGGPKGARAAVPLLAAAVLGTLAIVTVEQAGCADPGHYVAVPGGYELVGGCLSPDDLVVPAAPAAPALPAAPVPPRS
ncbi:hypothetical protein GCM10010472_08720 [Pseudonocardia halophobica]|uniref:Uncharacterized protein n=1 Tax=Pseudonocardia halophobica TaxID=29401 RepID=A0A9W6NXR1_9PSEU|nr:hypothetical protein [Pseudonocardia halophobica]GLL12988.1 hypothetical protein GCM10017577_41310 [Pseudonocardia halophobica]